MDPSSLPALAGSQACRQDVYIAVPGGVRQDGTVVWLVCTAMPAGTHALPGDAPEDFELGLLAASDLTGDS